jgi:hypothetical protein
MDYGATTHSTFRKRIDSAVCGVARRGAECNIAGTRCDGPHRTAALFSGREMSRGLREREVLRSCLRMRQVGPWDLMPLVWPLVLGLQDPGRMGMGGSDSMAGANCRLVCCTSEGRSSWGDNHYEPVIISTRPSGVFSDADACSLGPRGCGACALGSIVGKLLGQQHTAGKASAIADEEAFS